MTVSSWSGGTPKAALAIGATVSAMSDLLAEPEREPVHAGGGRVDRLAPLHELVADLVEADDRPGDELREERDVQREVERRDEVAGRAAVDVDQVADSEWNVKNEMPIGSTISAQTSVGSAGRLEHAVPRRHREVGVLEDREEGQVDDHPDGQRPPRPADVAGIDPLLDPAPDDVVGDHRGQQPEHESAGAPGVERQACDDQQAVASPSRHGVVSQQDDWQEEEEERDGRENHEAER